jgi:hypothetical protein
MSLYDRLSGLSVEARVSLLSDLPTVSDWDLEESYRSLLSDCHGTVSICGYEYDAADALAAVDPVAYRCGFADYTSEADHVVEWSGVYYQAEAQEVEASQCDS